MGRRSSLTPAHKRHADALRIRLTHEFRKLNLGVNVAQFTAQRFEQEMVELVRDIAIANETPINVRVNCAVQVVEWARGRVETWRHDGKNIDPSAENPLTGTSVGETIEAAKATAETFQELDRLVRQNVPFADWPESIRQLSEAAVFAEVEEAEAAD